MSLISEALKEAQRERTERAGPRAAGTMVDTIFAYPSKTERAAPNRALLIGGAAAVVMIGGAGLALRWFKQGSVKAPTSALPHRVVPVPIAAPKVEAPVIAKPNVKPAVSPVVATNTVAPRTTQSSTTPPKKAETIAPRVAAPDSVVAQPAASAPPRPAPTVQPQGAPATSGVHIVLDASGTRPSDSLFALAYSEQKRGNLDMARELYEKALAKPPVAPELYNNYGALLASVKQYTAAIVMYNLGLKGNENDSRLWSNLADAYNATGRHAEAMAAYAQAAKLDPANGVVKTRLAGEYAAIGDTSSARRMYDDALRVAAKEPAVHYAYGAYLQAQRDFRSAIREFQLFVDLAPGLYDSTTIDSIKKHIVALRRANQ